MAGNANSGRRPLSRKHKDELLRKLEPYLKSGLSVNKACSECGISKSNIYNIARFDPIFLENLDRFKQYLCVLVCRAMVVELHIIAHKQQRCLEKENLGLKVMEEDLLTKEERKFIMWFADHSTSAREEFSRLDEDSWDPRDEIRKVGLMIDECSVDNSILEDALASNVRPANI